MYIQFDPKTLGVQVLVGTLEKYEPTEQVRNIQELVDELKHEMLKFRAETVTPKLDAIQDLINEENKKYIKVVKDNKEKDAK